MNALFNMSTVVAVVLLVAGMLGSYFKKKLTFAGALAGGLMGGLVFAGAGFTGLCMLVVFFLLGTGATAFRAAEKGRLQDAFVQKSGRTAGQVLANGSVAALMGLLLLCMPLHAGMWRVMMAASLASAMADTLSSELGVLYGKRFYNCATWKRDERGLDGVVSLEGTLIGVAGAVVVALVYVLGFGWGAAGGVVVLSGVVGNFADSLLGAFWERKLLLGNDGVNFLSTLVAALVAGIFILNEHVAV